MPKERVQHSCRHNDDLSEQQRVVRKHNKHKMRFQYVLYAVWTVHTVLEYIYWLRSGSFCIYWITYFTKVLLSYGFGFKYCCVFSMFIFSMHQPVTQPSHAMLHKTLKRYSNKFSTVVIYYNSFFFSGFCLHVFK